MTQSNPSATLPGDAAILQPITAGLVAGLTGFASSFAILLAGFAAMGASPEQAASGLFAVSLGMGVMSMAMSLATRQPIAIAWSTPGAALLVSSAAPAHGYGAAVGAYLAAAVLIIAAGLWRPLARAVSRIPGPLANAMLAGILFQLCLAPVEAMGEVPLLALPVVAAWLLGMAFLRRYAVLVALLAAAIVIGVATDIPPGTFAHPWPQPVLVMPVFSPEAMVSIGVPLFLVTMASQNLPGIAVLEANGYRPRVGRLLTATGIGSLFTALLGGHSLNLAAITAALCAGPEAHPDPQRRWIAAFASGATLLALALGVGLVSGFFAAAPPLLIETVAGLALLTSLGGALTAATAGEATRPAAVVTFVTAASGLTVLGIGAAFWGLLAGFAVMAVLRGK